jgi:hypothetical protein
VWIDHIAIGVDDLERAAAEFRRRYGLGAVGGGVHPEGTRNRNIPLRPPHYIELVEVWDETRRLGRLAADKMARGCHLLGIAIEASDIGEIATRVGVRAEAGRIELPDGTTGTWSHLAHPTNHGCRFFMSYATGIEGRPERIARWRRRYDDADHDGQPGEITRIDIGGDRAVLTRWLGDAALPIGYVPGPSGVRGFAYEQAGRDVEVR